MKSIVIKFIDIIVFSLQEMCQNNGDRRVWPTSRDGDCTFVRRRADVSVESGVECVKSTLHLDSGRSSIYNKHYYTACKVISANPSNKEVQDANQVTI